MNTVGLAQMAGEASGPAPTQKLEITHIEIRRVQNGFVLAGINMDIHTRYMGQDNPQRVTYVAKDVDELGRLLAWFVDGKDIGWLPTINLPLFDMAHRPGLSPKELGEVVTDAVRQGIVQAAPSVYREPQMVMPAHQHDVVFGGPLNKGRG